MPTVMNSLARSASVRPLVSPPVWLPESAPEVEGLLAAGLLLAAPVPPPQAVRDRLIARARVSARIFFILVLPFFQSKLAGAMGMLRERAWSEIGPFLFG